MAHADPPLAGRFQLLEVVGAGGMGSVWRAWDLREHRFVALKVLRRPPLLDEEDLAPFVREQTVRIEHPHVAAPTGWVADDDRVALSMELVRGGSLADLVADRRGEPFTAPYVAELLAQLLDGLAAVHAAGIVHRDVKPANLLLEATGRGRPHLRISDFGVAARLDGPGPPAHPPDHIPLSVGTTSYAAPEQLRGAHPDPRQDLYSAGVTARRLLGLAPGPLDALVADLCQTDPDRRPACAVEARRRLDELRVPRPLRRPHVPARVGVPAHGTRVPRARRRPSGEHHQVPAWVLALSFVVSGATGSATLLVLRPLL